MADAPVFLFDRRVVVAVAFPLATDYVSVSGQVVEIVGLRTQFKVHKSLVKDPNTAEVTINNLAETTRSRMQAQAAKVVIRAGYRDTVGQIFIGDAHNIEHIRNGADWLTKIHAGDGARGLTQGRVSQSFAPGTPVTDVVATIGRVAGFDISSVTKTGKLKELEGRQFAQGYVAHGSVGKELDKILRGAGFEWSIQDGKLQVLRRGEANTERVIELTPASGLIGSPEYVTSEKSKKPAVLKFKALLSPEIIPGRRLAFESARHKGVHRVTKVEHTGDTHGDDWFTEGECEVIDSSVAAADPGPSATFKLALKEFVSKVAIPLRTFSLSRFSRDFLRRTLTDDEITFIKQQLAGKIPVTS